MLPLSIILFVFALVIAGLAGFGGLSTGAIVFAAGFVVLGTIAMLQFWRSRTPTPF